MNISFAPLASVSINHDYYSSDCRDIDFAPSGSTARLLQAGRMQLRVLDGKLLLLYEAESPHVPISSLAGKTLYFALRLLNGSFENFTKPVIADAALTPLFSNQAAPGTLDAARSVALVPALYAHATTLATRPVSLGLKNSTGAVLDTRTLGDATTSYDLRGLPAGEYSVEEDYGGGILHQRPLLLDADLRAANAWGVLALRIDAAFYASAANFTLHFEAREETLRYYVVVSNWAPADFDQLNVVDRSFTAEGRDEIVFTKKLVPFTDDFIQPSLLGDSSAQIAVFQSQTEVARQERGLRKLQLSQSSTVLIEHLPLPGPERAKADLIVHLSKP